MCWLPPPSPAHKAPPLTATNFTHVTLPLPRQNQALLPKRLKSLIWRHKGGFGKGAALLNLSLCFSSDFKVNPGYSCRYNCPLLHPPYLENYHVFSGCFV